MVDSLYPRKTSSALNRNVLRMPLARVFRRLMPNASPVKQLENDLQCETESDVIGRMDLFGGTTIYAYRTRNHSHRPRK